MTTSRGFDHIVHAVRNLEAARKVYEDLGFTATPFASHPWGTRNFLIQLDGAFVEVLEVVDPSMMEEAAFDAFSFGAFNRDFLSRGEGMSMLVLDSADPQADRAAFQKAGLRTYAPFSFERIARQPDRSEKKVAFDLTFTTHPALPDAAFFTCHHRHPENFWKDAYKRHQNGAQAIAGAILVMPRPADLHEFIEGVSGNRELNATSFGIECRTARGTIDIMTPDGFRAIYGNAFPVEDLTSPRFVATRVSVVEPSVFFSLAKQAGANAVARGEKIVLAAADLHGMALIIEASPQS